MDVGLLNIIDIGSLNIMDVKLLNMIDVGLLNTMDVGSLTITGVHELSNSIVRFCRTKPDHATIKRMSLPHKSPRQFFRLLVYPNAVSTKILSNALQQ